MPGPADPNPYNRFFLHPETFDPDRLTVNQFEAGGKTIAKIPKIKGRITRFKPRKNSDTCYIQLIIGRAYDREKRQSRNVKVTIGTDISGFLRDMMIVNEHYTEYFDIHGKLYNDPLGKAEKKRKAKVKPEDSITSRTTVQTNDRDAQPDGNTCKPTESTPIDQEEPTEEQMLEELKRKQALLDQMIAETEQRNEELKQAREELDSIRMVRMVQKQEEQANHINFLSNILSGHWEIIERQASKKPDAAMSVSQIRMMNEILAELQQIFTGIVGDNYLKLAQEPTEDQNPGKGSAGTTYGEMAIILQAYMSMILGYRTGKLCYRDE